MQEKVKKFNQTKNCHLKPMPVSARILDIQSEIGELAKEHLKATNYGTTEFELTDDFIMEFGDVMYSLMSLANEVDLNAEVALNKVIEKYKNRIKQGNSMGSEVEKKHN